MRHRHPIVQNNPDTTRFYINGQWRMPHGTRRQPLIDPACAQVFGEVALGDAEDARSAIAAARQAFSDWSATPPRERARYLRRIQDALQARNGEIAAAITLEMGAPPSLANAAQAPSGPQHFRETLRAMDSFEFEYPLRTTLIRREAIGVCALITPWNWPMNQMAAKLAPALAAGCTVVLKPSELAPLSAALLARIIDSAGLPPGVFNLVHGDGVEVGGTLCSHPDVDMVSFTGSNRAGVAVSQAAAPTVKRVALELGGKSACILLPDADLVQAVPAVVRACMQNSGQSCNAPSRLLVPRHMEKHVQELARSTCMALRIGRPADDPDLGPIANEAQYRRVLQHIDTAQRSGAELLCGGATCPDRLQPGFFVLPTVFANVTPQMPLARDEVFGPVLALMTYDTVDEAIDLANDSQYGLSGAVWGRDRDLVQRVAARLRTGMVHLNGAPLDPAAPFGGYKRSGNGREWGRFGLEEFLELKSVYGGA